MRSRQPSETESARAPAERTMCEVATVVNKNIPVPPTFTYQQGRARGLQFRDGALTLLWFAVTGSEREQLMSEWVGQEINQYAICRWNRRSVLLVGQLRPPLSLRSLPFSLASFVGGMT